MNHKLCSPKLNWIWLETITIQRGTTGSTAKIRSGFCCKQRNQKDFDDILKSAKDGAEYDNAGFW